MVCRSSIGSNVNREAEGEVCGRLQVKCSSKTDGRYRHHNFSRVAPPVFHILAGPQFRPPRVLVPQFSCVAAVIARHPAAVAHAGPLSELDTPTPVSGALVQTLVRTERRLALLQ
jgi:hypothetical protein